MGSLFLPALGLSPSWVRVLQAFMGWGSSFMGRESSFVWRDGGGFPDGVGLAKGWDLEIGTLFFSKAVAISCV